MSKREFAPTQDSNTIEIMQILQEARIAAGDSLLEAAARIEAASLRDKERGRIEWLHRITGDQYRAMEQNITKDVPLWVVMYLAHEYRISAERLLGGILEEYTYG